MTNKPRFQVSPEGKPKYESKSSTADVRRAANLRKIAQLKADKALEREIAEVW